MGRVHRLYVEKKPPFAREAEALCAEFRGVLGVAGLERVRVLNRYDVEGLEAEALSACVGAVFADPCTDDVLEALPEAPHVLAVEYLPGQYDQRADAAEQCIELLLGCKRPTVRTARVYLLWGVLSDADIAAVRKHLINPVESREAQLAEYDALEALCPAPPDVPVLTGFREMDEGATRALIESHGLAMNAADLACCAAHFREEGRDPTLTELKVLDTYWSDHCRHSTFLTSLDSVEFEDERVREAYGRYLRLREETGRSGRPVTLMDMATIGAWALKGRGKLTDLSESAEVNACTVRIRVNGEPWLLLFKNETHNHPTEIEPFGGAATCVGGAIRDPLSGRGYVYQSMRVTGAGDPRRPVAETMPGKLPQRTIVTAAAAGYSSYGNQIGIPAGIVDEIYHEGYVAKRMEIGAVIAAVPEANVRREEPRPGDVVFLLGGRTGRDGCGGASGSSRAHTARSLETCGAEVQKGNAPEERRLQRLFRNPEFTRMIKRCNDFGAGGVSVAVGELADGLDIDLDAVPLKYAGLDGTEIAISESQERMAIVVDAKDAARVRELAEAEDVRAAVVAQVTADGRVTMRWRGKRILDLPRSFIQSNGAERHAKVLCASPRPYAPEAPDGFVRGMRAVAADLNACSRRGLCERFDSSVGANSVLSPFGGRRQRTPAQAMVAKIPLMGGHNDTSACSAMAWGFDPFLSSTSPYDGAYMAVVESLCRLAAVGVPLESCHLSFQEYFGRPGADPRRWGLPTAALLGALDAQMDFGVAAIGGKDSMSGSFEGLDVPPTLVSFAQGMTDVSRVLSPEFKRAGSRVVWLRPGRRGLLPEPKSLLALLARVQDLRVRGEALAVGTPTFGGPAALVLRMAMGNGFGFAFDDGLALAELFGPARGSFVVELAEGVSDLESAEFDCTALGRVLEARRATLGGESIDMDELEELYEGALEDVFPVRCDAGELVSLPDAWPAPAERTVPRPPHGAARPRFLIPVFPGTNCEYESARAVERAGGEAEVLVVRTLTPEAMKESVDRFAARLSASQALFLPGGFSNGDEPDGSGKFIAIFLRSPAARSAVEGLLEVRGGLILGVCNGFQALVRTGLLPFGRVVDPDELGEGSAVLTFNAIGRHQSKIVRSRVLSNRSPWLSRTRVGDVFAMPVSHGEGRFVCGVPLLRRLAEAGQVATQYVDLQGSPTMDVQYNPNGSLAAVEGLLSPDGRIFGRMGHVERVGHGLYQNAGRTGGTMMFESAMDFLMG